MDVCKNMCGVYCINCRIIAAFDHPSIAFYGLNRRRSSLLKTKAFYTRSSHRSNRPWPCMGTPGGHHDCRIRNSMNIFGLAKNGCLFGKRVTLPALIPSNLKRFLTMIVSKLTYA